MMMTMLTVPELVLLGFAAFRATQLVTRDSILDGPRERFIIWAENGRSSWRTKLADLVECAWCAGWYLSGITLLVYLLASGRWDDTRWIVHGIEWFAVAGGQGILSQLVITSGEEAKVAGAVKEELEEDDGG